MILVYKFKLNKWFNNFFFMKCKKVIVFYDKVVDFLGWECKVILCKKGVFFFFVVLCNKKKVNRRW